MFKGKLSKVLVLGVACVAVVGMLALSACGGGSQSSSASSSSAVSDEYKLVTPGTLTVATSPDYAPMEYQENGEIKGYDIALIKEIAKQLGLTADVQNQAFDSLVTQVAGGKTFDCAISSITISDERAEQVAFTDAYYDSNLAIVVLKGSDITSRDMLNGQPIGAQSGSSGEDWAKENLKDSDYTPFRRRRTCSLPCARASSRPSSTTSLLPHTTSRMSMTIVTSSRSFRRASSTASS